jgi:hypothetical protein
MGIVGGSGYRVMQMRKAPLEFDIRPYPYIIDQNSGIVVQDTFYRWQGDNR